MKRFAKLSKKLKVFILVISIAIGSLCIYSFVDNDFEIAKNLDIFTTLFRELNYNYVDEIKPGELMRTGIDAMLKSLDPYTVFIPESDLESYKFLTTGEYGGIGAYIHKQGEDLVISEPYEGSPIQKAGVQAGDAILEINGNSMKNKTVEDISKLLKGEAGTQVRIKMKRAVEDKSFDVLVTRENIKMNSIPFSGMLDKNVAYISLSDFTQNAGENVKNTFLKLKEKNNVKGLILDLRGNGGGLLQEAILIANIFLDKGELVVNTKGKMAEMNRSYRTTEMPVDKKIPLVVLVDENTASASEIVSGAIQDLDRGVVIGQRTFGKGLVQNVVSLSYNCKLKVTISKYYIPSGRCIQAIDYSHKNKEGGFDKYADSLQKPFKTKVGRVVYDGKGIKPDVVIPAKKLSNISTSLMTKYLVFDFATKFKHDHSTIPPANEFQITDKIFNDFISYISDKDFEYTTESEKNLKNFKEIIEKEKYFDKVKSEYEALYNKILHKKNQDVDTFKDEIKELLKNEIVSRYYFQKGRIEASLSGDPVINQAIHVLSDSTEYKSILKGTL